MEKLSQRKELCKKTIPKPYFSRLSEEDIEEFTKDYEPDPGWENPRTDFQIGMIREFDQYLIRLFSQDRQVPNDMNISMNNENKEKLEEIVKKMRLYFISSIDIMQEKMSKLQIDNKRERQILLDILSLKEKEEKLRKEEEEQKEIVAQQKAFEENKAFMRTNSEKTEEKTDQEDSSLSIAIDTIEDNEAIYKYEINVKNKAVEDFHQKLVDLTSQLKLEKIDNEKLSKDLKAWQEGKELLIEENSKLKNILKNLEKYNTE